MSVLYGETFSDLNTLYDRRYGPIYPHRSDILGEMFITESALTDSDLGDENFRICSVLREYFLKKRKVIICKETQKQTLMPLLNPDQVLRTNEDLLSEFPLTIGQRQDRILKNFHILAPNYGDTINTLHSYDCFAKNPEEQFFFLQLLLDRGFINVRITKTMGGGGGVSPIDITAAGYERLEDLECVPKPMTVPF